jgi:hypothetical protein
MVTHAFVRVLDGWGLSPTESWLVIAIAVIALSVILGGICVLTGLLLDRAIDLVEAMRDRGWSLRTRIVIWRGRRAARRELARPDLRTGRTCAIGT